MTGVGERIAVVNADDVGLHPGLTDGALAAHDGGIVTSCSVVACGSGFGDAAARLRGRPTLDVGVHLALTGGAPLSSPREVASLIDGSGRFPPRWPVLAWRALGRRLRREEVERELRRQVERELEAALGAGYRWEGEARALCDPGVRDALSARGVGLATFRDLAGQAFGRNRSKPSA